MTEIMNLLSDYEFYSPIDTIERLPVGNINKTYKIFCSDGEKYILQQINNGVFSDVDTLMDNIVKTTERIKMLKMQKSLDKMQVINIKFTRNGKSYLERSGRFYRVYHFMKGTETYLNVSDLKKITRAGSAFGMFDLLLNIGNSLDLKATIIDFHNTKLRLEYLEQNYKKAPISRKNKAKPIYRYIISNRKRVELFQRHLKKIPERTVHNDTKLSNIAFDIATGEAVGVLDLDTVMNGYLAFDFADAVRSIAGPSREDECDKARCFFDLDKYAAFATGFLSPLKNLLKKSELCMFPEAVFQITIELAARFLSDYLDGDKYFNIEYEEQNFYRARCQALLSSDMDKKMRKIRKVAYNAYKMAENV